MHALADYDDTTSRVRGRALALTALTAVVVASRHFERALADVEADALRTSLAFHHGILTIWFGENSIKNKSVSTSAGVKAGALI